MKMESVPSGTPLTVLLVMRYVPFVVRIEPSTLLQRLQGSANIANGRGSLWVPQQ
jgi:hypothetical protein